MKRLLLLLIFFPVILFGQTRRKEIVDSIKAAAANLQNVSGLLTNNPGTRVTNIQVSDSGDYVNIVVRVHVIEPSFIKPISLLPAVNSKTGEIVAYSPVTATVPPVPPIVGTENMAAPSRLAVFKIDSWGIPDGKKDTAAVPPLPPIVGMENSATPSPLAVFKIDSWGIPDVKKETIMVQPFPDVIPVMSEALPLPVVKLFKIDDIVVARLDAVTLAPLLDLLPGLLEALPLPTVTLFKVDGIVVARLDTLTVPPMPDFRLELIDDLPLLAVVELAIENRSTQKLDTLAIPVLEDRKMPVAGMHLSDEGYSLLEKLEGFSPELYSLRDGGFTIGFGFFIPHAEIGRWEKGVTWEEAERIIRQKVPAYEDQVKRYINVPLTQNAFDALTMLAYNLGGFSKATCIVNDINEQADYDKILSDWKRFVHSKAPNVTKGLMNRRKDELDVRNVSEYQPERKIQILKIRK